MTKRQLYGLEIKEETAETYIVAERSRDEEEDIITADEIMVIKEMLTMSGKEYYKVHMRHKSGYIPLADTTQCRWIIEVFALDREIRKKVKYLRKSGRLFLYEIPKEIALVISKKLKEIEKKSKEILGEKDDSKEIEEEEKKEV